MEGIGPEDLAIDSMMNRLEKGMTQEVIFALSATIEGDTTAFFLTKKLKNHPVRISSLSRGLPVGVELEYTDDITLGRSILHRTPYKDSP